MKDCCVAGQQFGLASFNPEAPVGRQPSWSHSLTEIESSALTPFLERIAVLKDNLAGGQLISVFVGRRVQPLQHRAHPMWRYEGLGDPTRCLPQELDSDALLSQIQQVTKCSIISEMRLVLPYDSDHSPPQVCAFIFLVLFGERPTWLLMMLLVLQNHVHVLNNPPQPEDVDILDDSGASAA